ncbi:hypothetical protein GCM10009637_22310 [Brevibacterium luteolum]
MDNGVDSVLSDHLREPRFSIGLGKVDPLQRRAADAILDSGGQIIHYHNAVTPLFQHANNVGANVPGATGHQY